MRHWNYRVLRRVIQPLPGVNSSPEDEYGIYEAYYDSTGKIHSISKDPMFPLGDTLDELKANLERMKRAFKSPVLDYEKLPEPGALSEEDDLDDISDTEGEEEIVIKP